MQYAIELFFDKETEEKIYKIIRKIANNGLSTKFLEWKTRPHLSLACFNDVDEAKCIELLKDFSKEHKQMPAYMGSVGIFTDTRVVFLSPLMNKDMFKFHSELHECLEGFDTSGWEWYHPDRWAPHCTVAMTGEDSEEALYGVSDLVLHEFKKISGKFVSIGLVKVAFPVEEIFEINLSE